MNEETTLLDSLWQQAKEKSAEKNDGLLYFYGIRDEFAQLIVQECMSYMENGDIDFAKFMIKKHFGVEE